VADHVNGGTPNTGGRSTWSCARCATPETWTVRRPAFSCSGSPTTADMTCAARVKEGYLLMEWTKECMAAHG
jgi:hypothetical protein